MEIKLISEIDELMSEYEVINIDYSKPFDEISQSLRGMVVDVIDAVFLKIPEILNQERSAQKLLFSFILGKLNCFFKECLDIISNNRAIPKSFATNESYSYIHNFLIILINASNDFRKKADEKSLLHIGEYVCQDFFFNSTNFVEQ